MSSVSCFHGSREGDRQKELFRSSPLSAVGLACAYALEDKTEFDWPRYLDKVTKAVFDQEITFEEYLSKKDHPWYQVVNPPYDKLFNLLQRWTNPELLAEDQENWEATLHNLLMECHHVGVAAQLKNRAPFRMTIM